MSIKFDFRDFERVAKRMSAASNQVPFALARALNDGADKARKYLIEKTWPNSIHRRNDRFLNAALTTKGTRASKRNLTVKITDKLNRGSLQLHADGGTKTPKKSSLAIPSKQIQAAQTSRGVPKGLRPLAIPNSFKRGDAILQRPAKHGGKPVKQYSLRPTAKIKKDVPFREDFNKTMRREVFRAFGPRLRAAMNTRR